MKGLFSWVGVGLSGIAAAITLVLYCFGNEAQLNDDIRTVTSGSFWINEVTAPIAKFALYVNRETAWYYTILTFVLGFAAHCFSKWYRLSAEHLEELEEESELNWS